MNQRTYRDFDLAIEDLGQGHYRARVLDAPAGQARVDFDMPFSPLELENFLLKIGRPRTGVRRLESPEAATARAFGERLFNAVFTGEVGTAFWRSIDATEQQQVGLRVRLRLHDAPSLVNVPWEYLYLPTVNRHLVLSTWTPLVRFADLPVGAAPLRVEPPLRLLAMVSSPTDYPELDTEAEWAKLDTALDPLENAGLVTVDRLPNASLHALQQALRRRPAHIFHFIGHGGFDEQAGDGVLVMETGQKRARHVTGRELGTILQDPRTVRLAVLNACEGRGPR
ncbi:MAG: CHAT domain-containing protein [Acidimicrobiia bacterium]